MTNSRDEIALRIFCAMLARPESTIDLYPRLGEKQMREAFIMAKTFTDVAREGFAGIGVTDLRSHHPNPAVVAPPNVQR